MSEEKATYNYHPIQLRDVKVLELYISANPSCLADEDSECDDSSDFGFYHTHSEYNEQAKSFIVKVAAIIGREDEDDEPTTEFDLRVELLGVFEVDEERFPIEHINDFASKNAPIIMYPYLREHVFSLTTRAGFDSAVLPLFEVPVFKLQQQ
ncbi:protein-export chaperone SecB [Vibrio antiquarius]|uniref:protein-export chaperone SecB n=1 Tax=Vibrio antiquarius (strain Ex25) TaxID=150340 RepID=UPI00265D25E0|nr:protein-export chaperone SecB [Vibrio antiquarius]MCR9686254.1 protein-export chaperone SecB [Vibrio antiquarius]